MKKEKTELRKQTTRWLLMIAMILIVSIESVMAVPAPKRPINVTQKDGSQLTVLKYGDEFFNWTTTTDGYDIAQNKGIYYYVDKAINGKYQLSQQQVSNPSQRNSAERSYLGLKQRSSMASQRSAALQQQAFTINSRNIQSAPFPNKGLVRSLVILVEYKDTKFSVSSPNNAFTNQLNQEGYSVQGAVGSAKDYFKANSDGQISTQFDVYGPYTLSQPMAYYGGNNEYGSDMRPREMITEACELAQTGGVDFSQYDYNNDGFVDNVFVYYAGYNEAEGGPAESIWPHRWYIPTKPIFNGKKIDGYACTSEFRGSQGAKIAGIGTFCHEFGHVFGLVDLYDVNYYENGYSYGLGDYDVMTSGSYNSDGNIPPLYNALELSTVGWATEQVLDISNLGEKVLKPIQNHQIYRVNTDNEGEYFLIENRQKNASIWDSGIPGSGLMMIHIDKSINYIDRWYGNSPNSDPNHECAKFVYANIDRPTTTGWQHVPFNGVSGNNEWGKNTEKPAKSWSGSYVGIDIKGITKNGNNIVFTTSAADNTKLSGKIKNRLGLAVSSAQISLIKNQASQVGKMGVLLRNTIPGQLYTTTTDNNGNYEIAGINDGSYILTVTKDGYAPYASAITISKSNNELDIQLNTLEESQFTKLTYQTGRQNNNLALPGGMSFSVYNKYSAQSLRKYIGTSLRQVSLYTPFACEMQLQVYAGKEEGPIYTQDISITASNAGGYSAYNFAEGDIVIQGDVDYYIGFNYKSYAEDAYPAAFDDEQSARYNGTSNVISIPDWDYYWGTVVELTGWSEKGNYMMDIFLGTDGAMAKPNTVTIADSSSQVNLNYTLQLQAEVAPLTANPYLVWASSNSAIAKVDDKGLVTGLSEGSTTITATSVLDATVFARCIVTVTPGKVATLSGRITDREGNPISGVVLQFSEIGVSGTPSSNATNIYQAIPLPENTVRAKISNPNNKLNAVSYEQRGVITTNENGEYTLNDLQAKVLYNLIVTPPSNQYLAKKVNTEAMLEGANTLDIKLDVNPTTGYIPFKYHNNKPSYSLGSGSYFQFMIAIDSTSAGENAGKQISYIELDIDEMYFGNAYTQVLFHRPYDIINPYAGALTRIEQGGKAIVDLSSQNITIPRDEITYLTIMMPGALMMDKSTEAVKGYGNLFFDEARMRPEPITRQGDYSGNWVITAHLKDKEITKVESIEINRADTAALAVGLTLQLDATVNPWNSDYRKVIWSSSNPDVATVDQNGLVKGQASGTAKIYATAKDKGGVVGELTIEVQMRQRLEGRVVDSEGNLAVDAKMTFIPVQTQTRAFSSLSMQFVDDLVANADQIIAIVQPDGSYSVEIAEGDYRVIIEKEGFGTLKQRINIKQGYNTANFKILTSFAVTSSYLTYSNDELNNGIANGEEPFSIAVMWNKEDLKGYVGQQITRLRYAVLKDNQNIELIVFTNGDHKKPIFRKDIPATSAGWSTVILDPTDYITIPADKDIYLGYNIKIHDAHLAAIDDKDPVEGKSNLVYINDVWSNVSQYGVKGNWQVGMFLQTVDQIEGITLNLGQTKADLLWGAAAYTSFRISYGKSIEELGSPILLDTTKYSFINLTPGTSYIYRIEGSTDGTTFVEMFTKQFTTMAKLTDIPSINISRYEISSGVPVSLEVLNTLPGDVIVWKVDGVVVTGTEVDLEPGTHEISTEIKRSGVTYITKRRVVVKNPQN